MEIKNWQSVGVFPTFEEADQKRNELREKCDLVKVKRCGPGGNLFRVKTWNKPNPKPTKVTNKSSKKKQKKGKKNADIRTG
jgi:hypothetical protein